MTTSKSVLANKGVCRVRYFRSRHTFFVPTHFDVPTHYEDYVHRIGRTGRANNEGIAITFCNEAEVYHVKKIEQLIRTPIPTKKFPDTVKVEKADFEEKQDVAREIDRQKRMDDPDFKGAFHEKKRDFSKVQKNTKNTGKKAFRKGRKK